MIETSDVMICKRFNDTDIERIFKLITNSTDILIVTHITPDGDSVGSSSAIYSFCKRLMKSMDTKIQNIIYGGIDDIPESLKFIPNTDKYEVLSDIPEDFLNNKNALIFCADSSTPERCIPNYEVRKSNLVNILNIDHHITNSKFGTGGFNFVDTKSSSCSELVASLIMMMSHLNNLTILKECEAISLYTGMKTDSGNFTYAGVDEKTLLSAASISHFLPDSEIPEIDSKLSKTKQADFPLLHSNILSDILYYNDYKVAILSCRKSLLKKYSKSNSDDIKGIVNFPLDVISVKLSIFITEIEEESLINVSIRSRYPYNAKQLAIKLGGGGHELAAGANIQGKSYDEVLAMITKEVMKLK